MVDKVLVADTDALLLGTDAALGQVTDDAVQQVVNVCHCLPRSKGNVHLAVMLKELGLAVRALEAQRVKKRTLVRRDGHLLLVDTDLQLGKSCLFLHGPQFGDLHNTLQIVSVVGQQIEKSLSNFLSRERLRVLQAVQQGADGVVLSLSVHRSHSVPVRELTFSEEVQDVPLDGDSMTRTCPNKESDFKDVRRSAIFEGLVIQNS